jgi:hypothetical protein
MSNSRLLWPTQKQLRRRYDLMDRMMQKRGIDTNAARRVDGGLAFLEARDHFLKVGKSNSDLLLDKIGTLL